MSRFCNFCQDSRKSEFKGTTSIEVENYWMPNQGGQKNYIDKLWAKCLVAPVKKDMIIFSNGLALIFVTDPRPAKSTTNILWATSKIWIPNRKTSEAIKTNKRTCRKNEKRQLYLRDKWSIGGWQILIRKAIYESKSCLKMNESFLWDPSRLSISAS